MAHLDADGQKQLRAAKIMRWFLDPSIVFPNPSQAVNLEPLLINTVGSLADRPHAYTEIPNLFLAADYVRTGTDLACMEAANEAGRRATNALLDRAESPAPRAAIWPLTGAVDLSSLQGVGSPGVRARRAAFVAECRLGGVQAMPGRGRRRNRPGQWRRRTGTCRVRLRRREGGAGCAPRATEIRRAFQDAFAIVAPCAAPSMSGRQTSGLFEHRHPAIDVAIERSGEEVADALCRTAPFATSAGSTRRGDCARRQRRRRLPRPGGRSRAPSKCLRRSARRRIRRHRRPHTRDTRAVASGNRRPAL